MSSAILCIGFYVDSFIWFLVAFILVTFSETKLFTPKQWFLNVFIKFIASFVQMYVSRRVYYVYQKGFFIIFCTYYCSTILDRPHAMRNTLNHLFFLKDLLCIYCILNTTILWRWWRISQKLKCNWDLHIFTNAPDVLFWHFCDIAS